MALADSKVSVKIEADNRDYLKAVAQIEREEARAAAKRDAQLAAQLKAQGRLTEETFRTAKAQGQVGTAAGKAVDFVGGKLKDFGKGLVGGAIGGLFAGIVGGGISSIIQKLFEPPTPEEQRATLNYIKSQGDAIAFVGFSAETAAKALRLLGEAETAALEAAQRRADFDRTQSNLDKYSTGRAAQRYEQQLASIGTASKNYGKPGAPAFETLSPDEALRARLDAANEYAAQIVATLGVAGITTKAKDVYGIADELNVDLDVANAIYDQISVKKEKAKTKVQAARAASKALDKELLEWFQDQVAPTDTSSGRAILDAQAKQRAMVEDDRASRQLQLAQDFAAAEEQYRQRGVGQAIGALDRYKAQSPLEKIFGSAQEMQAIGEAFGGFADAVGASFEAIVTGSEGAGKAFRKFLSGSLLGIGKKAAVQAIYELALAISEPWDAGRHLLAAGKFALTATAAGVAAAALGGGGSTAASGSGGAAPTGNYSPGGAGGQTSTVFVYGDSFADDSPRMRQQKAARLLQLANRGGPSSGGPDDVGYN